VLLTVDVGNSQTVLATFDGARRVGCWRVTTHPRATSDEIHMLWRGLLRDTEVTGVAACSTVPHAAAGAAPLLDSLDVPVVLIGPGVRPACRCTWTTLGGRRRPRGDRAGRARAVRTAPDGRPRPVVVVDFGTSTNVDAVGPGGQFLGGALAPGVEVSLEALASRAAQLRSVELTVPAQAIGKNTVAALQSGSCSASPASSTGWSADRRELVAQFGASRSSSPPEGSHPWSPAAAGRSPPASPTSRCTGSGWPSSDTRPPAAGSPAPRSGGVSRPTPVGSGAVTDAPPGPPDDELPEQLRVRRAKLDRLREAGGDPYPVTLPRTTSLAAVRAAHPDLEPDTMTGERAGVTGRVIFSRNTGKLCFATLREGDAELQVMLSRDRVGAEALDAWKADVDLGDHVFVEGEVGTSRRGELSVFADSWRLAAKALRRCRWRTSR
jgi:pantothenate kinase type III